MNNLEDIEHILKQTTAPQPRRELRSDFTSQALSRIAQGPKPPRRPWWQQYLQFHKPATVLAGVAVLVLLGGSTYAATDGFTRLPIFFNVKQSQVKTLESGDKIVSVDTQDCSIEHWNPTTQRLESNDRTYLYRLKANSSLTIEQMSQMVQGNCEFAAQTKNGVRQSALEIYLATHPEDNGSLAGGFANEIITNITADSLTTRGKVQYNGVIKSYSLAFRHIAKDVLVTENGGAISWDSLSVGDSIAYVYRASGNALSNSETTPPWNLNTDETTLVYVEKNSANIQSYFDYTVHSGMDFEEVVPCDHGQDGYCAKYGPVPPPRTELDDSAASISIQDAVMYHNNTFATSDPAAIRELQQKTLSLFTPEISAKIKVSPKHNYLTCGRDMPSFFTPQNAKRLDDSRLSRAVLFTAQDGSQFTVTYVANTHNNHITAIQCP